MNDFLISFLVIGGSILLSWPLGIYLTRVMEPGLKRDDSRQPRGLHCAVEKLFARVTGSEAQTWKQYLTSMIVFNVCMFAVTMLILFTQQSLPLNPDQKGAITWDLIFNTTASFVTNTNLQDYSGEVR